MVTRTLDSTPASATHWSHPLHGQGLGLTPNPILRVWKASGLKPHLQDTFKLSTDPFFVEKVRDVAGLYVNPPERTRALVLCVDEKNQSAADR